MLSNSKIRMNDLIRKTSELVSYQLRYSDEEMLRFAVHFGFNTVSLNLEDVNEIEQRQN
jgi:hypothetical protein